MLAMAAPHSAQVEAALAPDLGSHEACGICKQADDPLFYIACSHKFHHECFDAYKATRGFSDGQMPCPMCKVTQLEAAALEQELRDQPPPAAPMPGPSIGAMEVQLLDGPMGVHAAQSASPECGAAGSSSSSNQVVPVMEQLRGLSEQDQMGICQLCGGKVGLAKATLRGKQAGTFRCRVCHSKTEIMRKRCGGFPPSVVANMSEKDIRD